ncbi:MAG: DUF1501 domain-containing protein [Planctomycetaceae bacterium]|nr:DUF1501 domain-containing protein [Planctomycetales bacterium]MCB9926982.1 DUF1501 domain-containing protein [Planctomycetaceae bacterium]
MSTQLPQSPGAPHAFTDFNARRREGLTLVSRRGMIKTGLAGMVGISLPALLEQRAKATLAGKHMRNKSVILLWMAGGPSHIDTWDPKPTRPIENRGPFGVTQTKLPGVHICEHLPKQAAMLDKFTILRSVDARNSSHQPNMVFQSGNLEATPRTNPKGDMYPAIASIVAKHHGANSPGIPPYVAFQTDKTHVGYGGYLGKQYDPFIAQQAAKLPIYTDVGVDTGRVGGADLFDLPLGLSQDRIHDRRSLLNQFDRLHSNLDRQGSMKALDTYSQQAVEMVLGSRAREAFDITREPQATRDRFGNHLWCQEALMARRLVEAGASFVTLDLSYHRASGTWDTHGDNIPPYGGIKNGLGPLLPLFDHLITTLVSDLEERGLLDDCLVIAMGEFGRTPQIGTQGSTDGRNHWPVVMSMCLAGGGYQHGQVIGATESDGGQIADRPITPGDLAATIYRHFGVPLDTTYEDERGRPHYAVQNNGQPLHELS